MNCLKAVREIEPTRTKNDSGEWDIVYNEYDAKGQLVMTRTTASTGVGTNKETAEKYTYYEYNAKGQLTTTYSGLTAPLQKEINRSYDNGNLPEFYIQSIEYDSYGRVVKTTDKVSAYTQSGTSGAYKYTLSATPLTSETALYDALSRAFASEKYNNVNGTLKKTSYTKQEYDTAGRVKITYCNNAAMSGYVPVNKYTYNNLGQLTKVETNQALTGSTYAYNVQYTYDNNGRVLTETTSSGFTHSYTYDIAGNATGYTLKRGTTTVQNNTYNYDILNRLRVLNKGINGETKYDYDKTGALSLKTSVSGGTTTAYTYNAAGLTTSMTEKRGTTVKYSENVQYTLYGQIKETVNNSSIKDTYTYDPLGRLIENQNYNGAALNTTTSYSYNNFDSLTSAVTTNNSDAAKNSSKYYNYNNDQQLLQIYEGDDKLVVH